MSLNTNCCQFTSPRPPPPFSHPARINPYIISLSLSLSFALFLSGAREEAESPLTIASPAPHLLPPSIPHPRCIPPPQTMAGCNASYRVTHQSAGMSARLNRSPHSFLGVPLACRCPCSHVEPGNSPPPSHLPAGAGGSLET